MLKLCVTRFKKGDHETFSWIYRRYGKTIRRLIGSRISDRELAEEITQETFIKAFRFRENYQEQYSFTGWLVTIAKNAVSDSLRSTRTFNSFSVSIDGTQTTLDDFPSDQKNSEELIMDQDTQKIFNRVLKSLTEAQKKALWMRAVNHLSYAEISSKLGLSLAAVKNLIYRAKQTMSGNREALALMGS